MHITQPSKQNVYLPQPNSNCPTPHIIGKHIPYRKVLFALSKITNNWLAPTLLLYI